MQAKRRSRFGNVTVFSEPIEPVFCCIAKGREHVIKPYYPAYSPHKEKSRPNWTACVFPVRKGRALADWHLACGLYVFAGCAAGFVIGLGKQLGKERFQRFSGTELHLFLNSLCDELALKRVRQTCT